MQKVINIENNYKLSIIPDDIVPLICDELQIAQHELSKHIQNYNGIYSSKIKRREYHNLVPLAIRSTLALLISGTNVLPTFQANYIALGNNNTPANINDVILGNEVLRGTFTNRYAIDNTAYLDRYWGSTEVGGNTYLEIGIFIDGTTTANTGYLLSRVIIDEQLAVNESLTINATITIN
jgi:hypothetical protein